MVHACGDRLFDRELQISEEFFVGLRLLTRSREQYNESQRFRDEASSDRT
jgi:hypothetical protein